MAPHRSRSGTGGVRSPVAVRPELGTPESASPSEATSATTGGDPSVRAAAEKLIADGTVPGAVVVIQSDGERQEIAVGESDLSSGAPMSASLPFRIASVSKAFSGAVVLGMVNEGTETDRPASGRLVAGPEGVAQGDGGAVAPAPAVCPDYIRSPKFVKDFIADPQMSRTPGTTGGLRPRRAHGVPPR